MKKKFLVLFLILLNSCGYQPLYINKDLNNFKFSKIKTSGNQNVNNKIIKALSLKEVYNDMSLDELLISSSVSTTDTSKNSKGQIETYRTTLKIVLEVTSKEKILNSKTFLNDFSYNRKKNNFDLVQYQDKIKNNLINQAVSEIYLYLSIK